MTERESRRKLLAAALTALAGLLAIAVLVVVGALAMLVRAILVSVVPRWRIGRISTPASAKRPQGMAPSRLASTAGRRVLPGS